MAGGCFGGAGGGADILPGVPLVHTEQFAALRANVEGYITSPFGPELLTGITLRS